MGNLNSSMALPLINKVRVVYEDANLVVVDKPAGLLTMGTDTDKVNTLYAGLRAHANSKRPSERIFIVHRLDREASGLLVFAKTFAAKEHLQNQFKDHSAGRRYIAVVEGRCTPDQITIKSHLAENAALRVYSTRRTSLGKVAITHVRVLKRGSKTTLLEVRLETGRKHQIRVHLAERGHPIVGDKTYGAHTNPIQRIALHGAHLEFRHPVTEDTMTFDSKPPQSFSTL
jgi:23S rRNA pseudouridine1911/1915/1917 synthase